jgi:hypothetical protein
MHPSAPHVVCVMTMDAQEEEGRKDTTWCAAIRLPFGLPSWQVRSEVSGSALALCSLLFARHIINSPLPLQKRAFPIARSSSSTLGSQPVFA